jgi:hypothetical protein
MRKTAYLLSVASLCGCVAAAPPPVPGGTPTGEQRVDPIPISLALEEIITGGVRQHLKNALAARFGTMLAGERTLNGRADTQFLNCWRRVRCPPQIKPILRIR